jgi:hypothetical protein
MRVTKLIDVTGIGQTVAPSSPDTFSPTTKFNKDGIVQVEIITNPLVEGTSLVIQGRLSPTAPWVTMDLGDGSTAAAASNYYVLPLMPEMRIVASCITTTTFRAWVID